MEDTNTTHAESRPNSIHHTSNCRADDLESESSNSSIGYSVRLSDAFVDDEESAPVVPSTNVGFER